MPKHRTTPIETVDIGDLITATWKTGDVTRSSYGRVANIRREGLVRVLEAEDGQVIVRYNMKKLRDVSVTMIDRYKPMPPALFELEAS